VTLENIYQHDENAEIVYLGRLISDFGIQSDLRAEEAIRGKYIGYLVNYWNQSVGSIVDLEI
jgi:hypothetical protein